EGHEGREGHEGHEGHEEYAGHEGDGKVQMARPRKVSGDEVFAATERAMPRLSPNELTLAAIAAEAGLTAGALVQRFGSKRDLLLALSGRYSSGTADMFA